MTDDLLNSEERADEFLLMGLRLAEGIDPERYAALSGRALDPRRIALLREEGAITVDAGGRLRVTQAGFPGARCGGGRSGGVDPIRPGDGRDDKLRAKTLRRAGDRYAAARSDPHHREAAFVGAVGAEAEQAVDAGKAGWIGQHIGGEPLAPCVLASAATSATAS